MKELIWLAIIINIFLAAIGSFIASPGMLISAILMWRYFTAPILAIVFVVWIIRLVYNPYELILKSHYDFDDGNFLDIAITYDGQQYFLNYMENNGTENIAIFDNLSKISEFMRNKFGVDLTV